MNVSPSLETVPQEVLEHIAFFAATDAFLGPPSALIPLLVTNRKIHSRLSITSNHHLYAHIFVHKFDLVHPLRRLGVGRTTPTVLARELQRRCMALKRIRERLDANICTSSSVRDWGRESLHSLLFHVYLLMLENEGKNELQLREYARIDNWLREYWFHEHGASSALSYIKRDQWPPNNQETSLAMWLFWFLLKPDDYKKDDDLSWIAINVMKVYALAAHKYNLTSPSWIDFVPSPRLKSTARIIHYSEEFCLTPPPLATPAILSFLTLVNQAPEGDNYPTSLVPSDSPLPSHPSHEWECEWGRCVSLGQAEYDKILTEAFRPGSVEGVWEGLFTYMEFAAYAALLSGAPPPVLTKSLVVRHHQTWKLREHHLLGPDPSHSDSGIEVDSDNIDSLPAGDPLRSYFPTGTVLKEHRNGIEVKVPGVKEIIRYQRASVTESQYSDDERTRPYVQDVIITGEGHSAWGQFNLVGRVRACDGFVSFSKEYVDGDRGKWLYRGYLVGNVNGKLAGRWRDTISPADAPGYEGCFAMSRRR